MEREQVRCPIMFYKLKKLAREQIKNNFTRDHSDKARRQLYRSEKSIIDCLKIP